MMKKEDILAMSRNENQGKEDERESLIMATASKIGMAVGGVLAFAIVIFSRIIDEPLLGLSAWSVYFSMFGSRRLYQYVQTKAKSRLVQGIIGIVFGICCLVGMVILGIQK